MKQRERITVCCLQNEKSTSVHACVIERFRDANGDIKHTGIPVKSLCERQMLIVNPYQKAETYFFDVKNLPRCEFCHTALLDSKIAEACRSEK